MIEPGVAWLNHWLRISGYAPWNVQRTRVPDAVFMAYRHVNDEQFHLRHTLEITGQKQGSHAINHTGVSRIVQRDNCGRHLRFA
jgi:hypothetical protein